MNITHGLGGALLPLLTLFTGCPIAGCALNTEPIERGMNKMVETVIQPAVEKVSEEITVRTAQLQGQGSLINPGYTVEFEGGMFNGVKGEFTIKATGVSANLAASAQGDAGQAASVASPAQADAQKFAAYVLLNQADFDEETIKQAKVTLGLDPGGGADDGDGNGTTDNND